jgi:hypothetical protein
VTRAEGVISLGAAAATRSTEGQRKAMTAFPSVGTAVSRACSYTACGQGI